MNKQKTKGYSLKKRKLKKWLYTHHLNQYFIAKKLNLKIEELKEKLIKEVGKSINEWNNCHR